jgi:signal transduction histidine kinase
VKFGLRFSLLLLLGALMLVSYLPLFFATSTYTRVGLERLQRENAIKLGRSVTAHLVALRNQTSPEAFVDLVRAQIQAESVHALSILPVSGPPLAVIGDPDLLRIVFAQKTFGDSAETRELTTARGPAILVYRPSPRGGVAAVVRVDSEVTRAENLSRLMGLYMAVGALAMLLVAYFAMTRWIVRPILIIERGAERVVQGARRLSPVERAPKELANLSRRLSQMTSQLRDDEESLRTKMQELQARTEELQGRTEELRLAQQSLVHSERLATVGRLAAGLAHEVGNPISALMGLLDLMLTENLSAEERMDFLRRMHRETARIDRVLSDLLSYARAGKGSSRIADAPGFVQPAVESVFDLLRPQKDFAELTLTHELSPGLLPVNLNQEELTQVLLNLVMNAADACERRGTITVRAEQKEKMIRLCVQDTGPGIAAEVQETLFEPFVSTKEVGKGTGLGLSVTRGLVDAASGEIWVENVMPHGARFIIELPSADC